METEKKKIMSLNVIKFICALLVLYIHVPFSTDLYLYQMPTRVAVPMFFAISGFFWYKNHNYVQRSVRIATRYFFWVAITVLYELCKMGFSDTKEIILKYWKAIPNANEYMIGVLWFMITLFWGWQNICIKGLLTVNI